MPPETGATTDPLTAAVQRDKVTQEVRKLSAEALKAEVDAYTPSLPASLPVGTTTAAPGTVSPIGALAAFKALEKAAARIRDHLPTEGVSGVWIVPAGHWMRAKTAHDVLTDQLPGCGTR